MDFFRDRQQAGQELAKALGAYQKQEVIVLGLPRGGVIVAKEIAQALKVPLDVVFTQKIGHPYQPEYAIAAVAENGTSVINEMEVREVGKEWFEERKNNAIELMKERRKLYLKGRKEPKLNDRIVIVVDDGIATGLSMQAVLKEIQQQKPAKLIVAVPVLPQKAANLLQKTVDELVALRIDSDDQFLGGIGAYYEDFQQISDEEVIRCLHGD